MRNRLSSLAARNKRDMSNVIEALAKRIGFRVAAGLSERVIYKELFLIRPDPARPQARRRRVAGRP